jgi:hypothetical protein
MLMSAGRHLLDPVVDTVVVCGYNFPKYLRATIYEASGRDLRVAFASDAKSGVYGWACENSKTSG